MNSLVTLSFDDARADTYRVAYSIMKKYGIVGTIHTTTGWVDGSWTPNNWDSAMNGPMTVEQLQECFKMGFEITPHGDKHVTEEKDLERSIEKLKEWQVVRDRIGYSFPDSIEQKGIEDILSKCSIEYARKGRSNKCYTLPMKGMYLVQNYTGSIGSFKVFNKHNTICKPIRDRYRLSSTVIKKNTRAKQVIGLLEETIQTGGWNILMLHSILEPNDRGYGKDSWYWDSKEFEILCRWLKGAQSRGIEVVTLQDGYRKMV